MSSRRWSIAVVMAAVLAVVGAAASTGRVFGAKAEAAFKNDTEKASYAIGLNLAKQLKMMASELDDAALLQGFNDGRSADGKSRLTAQEISATLLGLRKTYHEKRTAANTSAGKPVTVVSGISVFFKMDPRLTASYGGDRWVSPATYTRVGDATSAVIEARAQAGAVNPTVKTAGPRWTSSDPDMVQITPDTGGAVTITVKRAGTSNIRVTSGEMTKELAVKAEPKNNALYVEIAQK